MCMCIHTYIYTHMCAYLTARWRWDLRLGRLCYKLRGAHVFVQSVNHTQALHWVKKSQSSPQWVTQTSPKSRQKKHSWMRLSSHVPKAVRTEHKATSTKAENKQKNFTPQKTVFTELRICDHKLYITIIIKECPLKSVGWRRHGKVSGKGGK